MAEITARDLNQVIHSVRETQQLIGELDTKMVRTRSDVLTVNSRVNEVDDALAQLIVDFNKYVQADTLRQNRQEAQNERSALNDDLERQFGHYREIRNRTIGILEASDYGIVRSDDLLTFASESFINSPNYWLSAALMALVSWLNDDREKAEIALGRAMELDDEKTSLMFGLICRRSRRNDASLIWLRRFLRDQDPNAISVEVEIVISAYAAGLFPHDSEHIVLSELQDWLSLLKNRPDFDDQMQRQWSGAMDDLIPTYKATSYPYLRTFSPTWYAMEKALCYSLLHREVYNYFEKIFSEPISRQEIREQLDEELMNLISHYDEEELPLRRQVRENQLIIDYEGDKDKARDQAQEEYDSFEATKPFAQFITDVAMRSDISHAGSASQKFVIAFSRDYVSDAYESLIAKKRSQYPATIAIKYPFIKGEVFEDSTPSGKDEKRIINNYNLFVNRVITEGLEKITLTPDEEELKGSGHAHIIIGAVVGILGLFFAHIPLIILGAIIFAAIWIYQGYARLKAYDEAEERVAQEKVIFQKLMREQKEKGEKELRSFMAEVVDYQRELKHNDEESSKVEKFLDALAPEEYVQNLSGSPRKVLV